MVNIEELKKDVYKIVSETQLVILESNLRHIAEEIETMIYQLELKSIEFYEKKQLIETKKHNLKVEDNINSLH